MPSNLPYYPPFGWSSTFDRADNVLTSLSEEVAEAPKAMTQFQREAEAAFALAVEEESWSPWIDNGYSASRVRPSVATASALRL